MPTNDSSKRSRATSGMSRRSLFKLAGAAGLTLMLPRTAKGAGPAGPVKRVILILCGGGVRWQCTFDGQADYGVNPWGVASWGALQSTRPAPEWGFGRMLMQKPVVQGTGDWTGTVIPHLRSDAQYNVQRTVLPSWGGLQMPTIADVASEIAVVRANNNPYGLAELDHGIAAYQLFTGSAAGIAGIATAIYDGLKAHMGANADAYYTLPPITLGGASGFGIGYGPYASSRPIHLMSAEHLPSRDTTVNVSDWGRSAEDELDAAFAAGRPRFIADQIGNLTNDKAAGDAHASKLLKSELKVFHDPAAVLGNVRGTSTPLTNGMLRELFGTSHGVTPAGDILFDAYASNGKTEWSEFAGYNAGVAIRALQMGAPVVAFDIDGLWDSHASEIQGDPRGGHPMAIVRLARTMAALEFALRNIDDPKDPGASLWDSTVVVPCSEFGRPDGFNVGDGGPNGGGSDHGPWAVWPIMGGPVVQGGGGGKLVTSDANNSFFHQNQVYTTLMAGMGIEPANATYLQYEDFPPISGVFQGV